MMIFCEGRYDPTKSLSLSRNFCIATFSATRLDFLTCILIIFYSDTFDKIDNNLTFIILSTTGPVFDLGMSFGKVKSGKLY